MSGCSGPYRKWDKADVMALVNGLVVVAEAGNVEAACLIGDLTTGLCGAPLPDAWTNLAHAMLHAYDDDQGSEDDKLAIAGARSTLSAVKKDVASTQCSAQSSTSSTSSNAGRAAGSDG